MPLPATHQNFLNWVNKHPNTPIEDLVRPYNEYEASVRKLFAQEPSNPVLEENHLNIVPLYGQDGSTDIRVRARNVDAEPPETREKYIMPLKKEDRRPHGSPAVVPRIDEFRNNFNIFSEGSLSDMDWNNVVVAGSAVVTSLLPVPDKFRGSKRGLREFYHEQFAPASDVDLFLYGLTDEQAVEKIRQIEDKIKNAILYETTTVRTKNAITIASQYPTRHVQIVLRIYKSISEILTGFDVDCSCAAYDGKQVYASPRALASYVTQINTIDLSRRSPSYENRLSKYSHRGFEVFWPELERSRIDPTIYERSFSRIVGLARLLVLEKMPKSYDRDRYLNQRRLERGRPVKDADSYNRLWGNIKNDWEDEVPEWQEGDDISNYNTFTIPYGQRFNAKKIEKLVYTKDMLLNAEWNRPKDRQVNLHRHPAFFGNVEDVIHDCCGYCPVPTTQEDHEVAEKESKTFISGDIEFIKDDPGRQEIGSFNPITETEWTEMAYVGNTERLCQAIVDHDIETIKQWFAQEDADPNSRDYTGRAPLHLACMASTPEIVQFLVDNGARLTARIADGQTALHLAAARGRVEIVKILLTKSQENEAEEEKKQDKQTSKRDSEDKKAPESEGDEDDMDIIGSEDAKSDTSGSFVKVEKKDSDPEDMLDAENEEEPDIYDINVVSWDTKTSPLHLAILHGHVEVVEELAGSFGADVLLPIKLIDSYDKSPRGAILTLVLALRLPFDKAKEMAAKLLQLGASPAQADLGHATPVHYTLATEYNDLLDVLKHYNQPALQRAINYIAFEESWYARIRSPLLTGINARNVIGTLKLLELGAAHSIDFMKEARKWKRLPRKSPKDSEEYFRQNCEQPIIIAVDKDLPEVALDLLARGADPNLLTANGYTARDDGESTIQRPGESLLDFVWSRMKDLRQYSGEPVSSSPPRPLESDDFYLKEFKEGTYRRWTAEHLLKDERIRYAAERKSYDDEVTEATKSKSVELKKAAVKEILQKHEQLEKALLEKGALTFRELCPQVKFPEEGDDLMDEDPEGFKIEFDFQSWNLDEERKNGYLDLFEAAWSGDLATIKSLTLAMWGEDDAQGPLEITIKDQFELTPFSIAVVRGHWKVAKAIVEISQAQYKPSDDNGDHKRFQMDEDMEIYEDVIDDKFTIENIGEVRTQVESNVSPVQFLTWGDFPGFLFSGENANLETRDTSVWDIRFKSRGWVGLFNYAVQTDNLDLLRFMLSLGEEIKAHSPETFGDHIDLPFDIFQVVQRTGNTRFYEEIIKRTGADLPLNAMVAASGIEVHERPEFYPGLSIHGKKRADWAAANRKATPVNTTSPLLSSAFQGNLRSTEWFLSTAPARCYLEFINSHPENKHIKLLAESEKGIERPLMDWLRLRNNLVLHCAVLTKPTDESIRLVEYLVKQVPGCLEAKSGEGHTPLALAFTLHHEAFAKILVQAGANQAVRDGKGNNLIHLLLGNVNCESLTEPGNLEGMLKLIDPRLIESLLIQRSSDGPGSLTPIARWMHGDISYHYECSLTYIKDSLAAIVRCLLEFAQSTGQKHLDVLDGTGNTPVHHAVQKRTPSIFQVMLEYRPDMLYRENATGSTPMELAVDSWVAEVTSDPPKLPDREVSSSWRSGEGGNGIMALPPDTWVDNPSGGKTNKRIIYDICRETALSRPGKRRLVSLNEANEVTKRLSVQSEKQFRRRGEGSTENDYEEKKDEVASWMEGLRLFPNTFQ